METKNWRTLVQWSRNSFNLGIFFNICFLTVKIVIQFAGLLENRIDPTLCYGATHAYEISLQWQMSKNIIHWSDSVGTRLLSIISIFLN